jgi:hypothetical protein
MPVGAILIINWDMESPAMHYDRIVKKLEDLLLVFRLVLAYLLE